MQGELNASLGEMGNRDDVAEMGWERLTVGNGDKEWRKGSGKGK